MQNQKQSISLGHLREFKEYWPCPKPMKERFIAATENQKRLFGKISIVVGKRKELNHFSAWALGNIMIKAGKGLDFRVYTARDLTNAWLGNKEDKFDYPEPSQTLKLRNFLITHWKFGTANKELPNVVLDYLTAREVVKDGRTFFLTEVDFPEMREYVEEMEDEKITLHYLSEPKIASTEKNRYRRDKELG